MNQTVPLAHAFGLTPRLARPALTNCTTRAEQCEGWQAKSAGFTCPAERVQKADGRRADVETSDVATDSLLNPIALSLWTTLFEAVDARVAENVSPMASDAYGRQNLQSHQSVRDALLECAEAFGQLQILFPVSDPVLFRGRKDLLDARIARTMAHAALHEN